MTWQKVVDHINDARILVESLDGNRYPVETEYGEINETVYSWAMGDLAPDTLWVDVNFDGQPSTDRLSTGNPSGGPPQVN